MEDQVVPAYNYVRLTIGASCCASYYQEGTGQPIGLTLGL